MRQCSMSLADVERGRNTEKSNLFVRLWQDDCGALLATEWVVVATVMVLGIVPGLIALKQGVLSELLDVANATLGLDQSYGFTGHEIRGGAGDRAANDQNNAGKNTAKAGGDNKVLNNALRVGTVETRDAKGNMVQLAKENRGGVQAFTAGSGFLENRHLDGIVNRSSTATVTTKTTKGSD